MPRRKKTPAEDPAKVAAWNEMLMDNARRHAELERDIASRPPKLMTYSIYIGGTEANLKVDVLERHADGTITFRKPDGSVLRRHRKNFL
jgi:hypothetical protein